MGRDSQQSVSSNSPNEAQTCGVLELHRFQKDLTLAVFKDAEYDMRKEQAYLVCNVQGENKTFPRIAQGWS